MKKPARTDVFELVKTIDNEFSARQETLDNREAELQVVQDKIAAQKAELELAEAELAKEKAGFDALKEDVTRNINKIRNDQQLSDDLRAQALTAKNIEKELKEVKEERGLTELLLVEIAKREVAVGLREKNYKEELKKEFAATLFKG